MNTKKTIALAMFLLSLCSTQSLLASDNELDLKPTYTTVAELRESLPAMLKKKWPGLTEEEVAGTINCAQEQIDFYQEVLNEEEGEESERAAIFKDLEREVLKAKYPARYLFSTMYNEQMFAIMGADPEKARDDFVKESAKFIASGLCKGLSLADANERASLMKIAKKECEDNIVSRFFGTRLPLAPEGFKSMLIENYGDHFKDDIGPQQSLNDFLLISVKETIRKFAQFKPLDGEATDAYYDALSAWIWDQSLPAQEQFQHVVELFK